MSDEEDAENAIVGCFGCCGLAAFCAFLTVITSWVHLGPDEQVKLWRNGRQEVINGPYSKYHGLGEKKFRKATLMEGNQYVFIQNIRNGLIRTEVGPQLYFLTVDERVAKGPKNKLICKTGEYVRLTNQRNGQEQVVTGPAVIMPEFYQDAPRGVEQAIVVDADTAVLVENKALGRQMLITTPGIFVPTANQEIIALRSRMWLSPSEAAVVQGGTGMKIYSGADGAGKGLSFFLQPYELMSRLYWSNFREPEFAQGRYTTTTPLPGSRTTQMPFFRLLASTPRRRRTIFRRYLCTGASCYLSSYAKNWDWKYVNGTTTFGTVETCQAQCSRYPGCTGIEWPETGKYCLLWLRSRCNVKTRQSNSGWHLSEWNPASDRVTIPPILTCSVLTSTEDVWRSSRDAAKAVQWVQIYGVPDPWGREINGQYQYQTANLYEPPAFKQESGNLWLYMSMAGRWWVSTQGNMSKRADSGILRSEVVPVGRMPEIVVTWQLPPFNKFEQPGAVRVQRSAKLDARAWRLLQNNGQSSLVRRAVTKIDLKVQKSFYSYETRTSDNVKIQLKGVVYWQVTDVRRMMNSTGDPEGDVWYKSRAALIQQVSNTTLITFMADTQNIARSAAQRQAADSFFSDRGLAVRDLTLTQFLYLENRTRYNLQRIINQTTKSMIKNASAATENSLKELQIQADIAYESQRSHLLQAQALNARLIAQNQGATTGEMEAMAINSFIKHLGVAVPNMSKRLEIYTMFNAHKAALNRSLTMARGNTKIFVIEPKPDADPNSTNLTMNLTMKMYLGRAQLASKGWDPLKWLQYL